MVTINIENLIFVVNNCWDKKLVFLLGDNNYDDDYDDNGCNNDNYCDDDYNINSLKYLIFFMC